MILQKSALSLGGSDMSPVWGVIRIYIHIEYRV